MTYKLRRTTTVPSEFDEWIKKVQRDVYKETNEILSKTEIMKLVSNSKVNVKRKKDENKISFGI